jgi:hypothetical protein
VTFHQGALLAYSMLRCFNEKNVPFRLIYQKVSQGESNVNSSYQIGWKQKKPSYGQGHGDFA